MLKEVFDILAGGGINTYYIGQHKGECGVPYVVVKDGGSLGVSGLSLNRYVIDIIVFFPFGQFDGLEGYIEQVKEAVRGLDGLRDARYRSQVVYDDEKRAYTTTMRYFGYQAYQK